jgi:hypothetical protein
MEVRDIPGYPGYKATSVGTVIGKKGKEIGCFKNRYVLIGMGFGKSSISRGKLILLAFVGPKPFPEAEVDHINRNKHDDRPENLRWDTRYNQMQNRSVKVESTTQVKGLQWVNPSGRSINGRWRCTITRFGKDYVQYFPCDKRDDAVQWLISKRQELNITT